MNKYDIDTIVTKNKSMFKKGSKITQAQFIKLFGLPKLPKTGNYKDLHRANMKLVALKEQVNYLMRANGLYLKAKDYNSYFMVMDSDRTETAIVRYSAKVERNEACERQLEDAYEYRTNAGTWGTYNRVFDRKTKRMRTGSFPGRVVDNAGRAANTLNRVTN